MLNDGKKHLILMRGVPGSGKTTFVANMLYSAETFVICPDDIRDEFAGMKESWGDKFEYHVWKIVDERLKESLLKNRVTVIDATFIARRSVLKQYRVMKEVAPDTVFTIVDFSDMRIEQCLANNQKRKADGGRFVPEEVIKNMYTRLKQADLMEFKSMVVSHNNFIREG